LLTCRGQRSASTSFSERTLLSRTATSSNVAGSPRARCGTASPASARAGWLPCAAASRTPARLFTSRSPAPP